MILPSMIWSIFLLASSGVLYFDANEGIPGGSSKADLVGMDPSISEWITAHKLPGSYDDFVRSGKSYSFRGAGAVTIRPPSTQAVCNLLTRDDPKSLNGRRLGFAPNILGGTASYITSGLNMLYSCLFGGYDSLLDSEGVAAPNLTPYQLMQRQLVRGIKKIFLHEFVQFPTETLLHAMTVSHKSYRTEEEVQVDSSLDEIKRDQVEGFPIFIPGEEEYDTQAYAWLSRTTKTLTIAFRGTQTVTDIIHDLDYVTVPLGDNYPNILVHRGFKGKVSSILYDIMEIFTDYFDAFDTVMYTGHSLGGALATLTAPIMAAAVPSKRHECLTFGSPRVGNSEFAKWHLATVDVHMRITNEKDGIPVMPFEEVYQHVGPSVTMSDDLELTHVPETPAARRFLYALEDFVSLDRMRHDHHMTTYIERMTSIFKKSNL